ncbi:MAG: hypothetical protein WCD79_19780 [Chthoniobacteraceae bacterium]
MRKSAVMAVVIIALFGAAKMRFEQKLTEDHRAAFFHGAKLNLNMRQQIGQLGFLAALSGFRSVVADLIWFEAQTAWERTEWGRVALLCNNVTALEPRNVMFWDLSAWHMGYNASNFDRRNPKQPREALRIKAQRNDFNLAEDFLLRGIENNPDHYKLYESMATLYKEKFAANALTPAEADKYHLKASEYYEKAAQFPNSPTYEKRFTVYELSHVTGHEREAYEKLVKLYKMGEKEWLPTLLLRLNYLQEKLNIPPDQRVYTPPDKK